ncbi:MAG: aldolase [Clostridia bacterium]|nr:aldolase [Clostridia bacterium]
MQLFYITNRPDVALVAEKYGVDRVWVDLETRGKELRQKNLDTVKSHHCIEDISKIKPRLTAAEMMVRINSWYEDSAWEIEKVLEAGADWIMLPYWKTVEEVNQFLNVVKGRCKTSLLLETKEAVNCVDDVLTLGGFDEMHIGINDLCISYGKTFLFEMLTDGTVEFLCKKFKSVGIPYGFGGIARLGEGLLPAEKVLMEHYRLGSTRVILSRSFCDYEGRSIEDIEKVFRQNVEALRQYEATLPQMSKERLLENRQEVICIVKEIVQSMQLAKENGE